MRPFWRSKTSPRFAFVDLQNDVTEEDVVLKLGNAKKGVAE